MGNSRSWMVLGLLLVVAHFSIQLRAQNVSVSPTGLAFGTVPLQYISAPSPILLTNNSSSPLQINWIVASAGYAQTNNCASSLPALGNCTISATLSAGSTLGPVTGSISIFDSDISSPQIVNLSGTSVVHMEVGGYNPQPIVFGLSRGRETLR